MKISLSESRAVILNAQMLKSGDTALDGTEGLNQIVDCLGYIQIDTINVIERAHHHTLFTRVSDYKPSMLHDLQAKDRTVFEYWGHAMSYLPMKDFRFYLPRMRNFLNPRGKWMRTQMDLTAPLLKPVLKRIREEGPLSAKDFKKEKKKSGTWWDWKPAKVALELLFWQGKLMVTERRNFQKVYDLNERVLPESVDQTYPDADETGRFLVHRALKAMGIANEKEIQKYLQPEADRDSDLRVVDKNTISRIIREQTEVKEIAVINIEGENSSPNYGLPSVFTELKKMRAAADTVFILSPFDNLIIQRNRLKRLFDFEYTLECYLPESKRNYGYFVLPILYGTRFAGRMDAQADRKNKAFIVKNLMFEDGFVPQEEFLFHFSQALQKLTRFNNCTRTELADSIPQQIRKALL